MGTAVIPESYRHKAEESVTTWQGGVDYARSLIFRVYLDLLVLRFFVMVRI